MKQFDEITVLVHPDRFQQTNRVVRGYVVSSFFGHAHFVGGVIEWYQHELFECASEGLTWARGWDTPESDALRAHVALG